jgi:hypothetical protein
VLRHSPGLAPKALGARFCSGDSGADPLRYQIAMIIAGIAEFERELEHYGNWHS